MILAHLASYFDTQWPYENVQAVTREITQANPHYAGMTWEAIGDGGCSGMHLRLRPEAKLGKVEQPELPDVDGALRLVSGTVLYDGGDLFALTKQMAGVASKPSVGLNPADAERLGVAEGMAVKVRNEYGAISVAISVDDTVKVGTAWIPASLPGAPVGSIMNGGLELVNIEK